MNLKNSLCHFIAKFLVTAMILQGMPLWELSRSYTYEFQPEKFEQLVDLISLILPADAEASVPTSDSQTILFEKLYISGEGDPFTETETLSNFSGSVIIQLFNGGTNGDLSKKVSSARVTLNGETIFGHSDLNQNVDILEKKVILGEEDKILSVFLMGKPGGKITIRILQDEFAHAPAVGFEETFIREKGAPVEEIRTISNLCVPAAIKLINGRTGEDPFERISSAVIKFNGEVVFTHPDLNQNIAILQKMIVPIDGDNILSVLLMSQPGSGITLQILQEDSDGDEIPDCSDNCPDTFNPGQEDTDGNGIGDACESVPDADADGIADIDDNCPAIPNPDQADGDGDGVGDACDNCPQDPNKTEPGICGCGVSDTDFDGDGTPDCNDGCPNDPGKTDPGICGCGTSDVDTDGDGVPDCNDNCPDDPAKTEPGVCGCGISDNDSDSDGIPDCIDNCPATPNPGQEDSDGNGIGDACELAPDSDGDGVPDTDDNCPNTPNPDQVDTDGDNFGDVCDNCPEDQNKTEPGICGCGVPDIDTDEDGTLDCNDLCPDDPDKTAPGECGCGVADIDSDEDGVPDCNDICPGFDDTIDSDGDGIPDGCDTDEELPPDPAEVAPALNPTEATSLFAATEFLYSGDNPIQTGMGPLTIEENRAAVIRGKVMNKDGEPLAGVTITILNHPEYGQTLSREDGMFDIAVNGGDYLIVNYAKAHYLPAQRQVSAPWQDWIWAPDVVMIQLDPQVTTVNLAQTAENFVVARGSVVSDDRGDRQNTLLFPQGVNAELVMPDDSIQPISTLNVRVTEYSMGPNGPDAMPAVLPPGIGYTYCAELSVDEALAAGAKAVNFSEPVFNYLENFLGFGTGVAVPVYFYDREKGAWVSAPNGLVIKIVDILDGLAQVDTDGDGVTDDPAVLAALGITDAERQQLAGLYAVEQSLWRVPVSHFSPCDYNWPIVFDADAVNPELNIPDLDAEIDCETTGSIVKCQSQVLGESIGVSGTPFSLNYRSSRTGGYAQNYTLDFPLTGDTWPSSLREIRVFVNIAGQSFEEVFTTFSANMRYQFAWDGKDAYGRDVSGSMPVTVLLAYMYEVYYNLSQLPHIVCPLHYAKHASWQSFLNVRPPTQLHIDGWSLSPHHSYDMRSQTIYLGSGEAQKPRKTVSGIISTLAGTGSVWGGYSGDEGPATEARLDTPYKVSVAKDGTFYIADTENHAIRKVDFDGIITTVVGTGTYGYSGDGGLATEALLRAPEGVTIAPDGNLYIADYGNDRVRKVDPSGIITTVAGGGTEYEGGVPATEAWVDSPVDVSIAQDGSLYIASYFGNTIQKVDPVGIITIVAGGGYDYVEGAPATDVRLYHPMGICVSPDGSLYIALEYDHVICKVDPSGIISTVAGNWISDYSGDAGPATEASLYYPNQVSLDPYGNLYIADSGNYVIRKVDSNGIILTIAGNGTGGYSGDGGPAKEARLNFPRGVTYAPDGNLYIADTYNNAIRKVTLPRQVEVASSYTLASADGSKIFQFDSKGRHMQTLNALSNAVLYEFTYDPETGLLTNIIDGNGNITTIGRDYDGNPTAIVSPYGLSTTLSLDFNGFLNAITNPAYETWQFINTDNGLINASIDPNGNTSTYTYNDQGFLTQAQDAAGGYQTLERSNLENGYEVTHTTALGRTTTYRVENLDTGEKRFTNTFPCGCPKERIIGTDGTQTTTGPDGTITTIVEGPDPRFRMQSPIVESMDVSTPGGLNFNMSFERSLVLADESDLLSLQTQTDTTTINGRNLTSEYDAATRILTKTTPQGRTRVDTFNKQQQVVETALFDLEPTQIAYDADGRMTSIVQGTDAAARELGIAYNSNGFISSITDPMARILSFEYDAAGRIITQTLAGSYQILFDYDAKGNLISITPPGQPAHNFVYTAIDKIDEYTPPALGAIPVSSTYIYNLDRQLIQLQRPDGATLDIGYDSAGRVSTRTLPRGTIGYTYDGTSGLLSEITAPGSETLYLTYDGTLLTGLEWTGTINGSIEQVLDNNFQIVSRSINGAHTIAFAYDQDGLLTQAGSLNITRDAGNGFINETTLGSVADSWIYNGFGETIHYTANYGASPRYSAQYTRDKLGRITEKTETVEGTTHTCNYTYDTAGRLTEVEEDAFTIETYTYDDNGNRLSADGVSADYDSQDRLYQFGTASYTYTNNGELNTKTIGTDITTYSYDVIGSLMGVELPDGTDIQYIIDGSNRRIGKTINGFLVQGFLYKDQLNPVAELDGTGAVVSRFVYASKPNVPDYMIMGGSTYRIISDHLGSPRLVIDIAIGTTVQRMDYDAFGNVVADTNPGFQPFGFAGGLYDPDTGLTRFGARDYDAETGRWTAKDPILFAGGTPNLYSYVMNDPENWHDTSGLIPPLAALVLAPLAVATAEIAAETALGIAIGETFDGIVAYGQGMGVIPGDSPIPSVGPTGVATCGQMTFGQMVGNSLASGINYLLEEGLNAYYENQSAQQLSDLYDRLIREHQEREIQRLMDEIRQLLYGCN